jgi:hypothetical protein
MKNDRLIPGTILVIIGILFLLDNFNVIDFSWGSFFSLWPILLIIGGVNLVFAHNKSNWATALKIVVLLCGMAVLIVGGLSHRPNNWSGWNMRWNRDFDDNSSDSNNMIDTADGGSVVKVDGNTTYHEAYKPGTLTATLNISGGATAYLLQGVTNDLFEATTKEHNLHYSLKSRTDSTNTVVDFDMAARKHGITFNWGKNKYNKADIKLNSNPEWQINIESGASSADFDLSFFKISKLNIQGGAASYNVKLGQPLATTDVDIQTGAASVTIRIPKNAACRITTDTGLSSKNFDGFDKKDDDDSYQTPGFDKATNKMNISIEGAMSDFKVIRY